jgi:D-alanine-D-alanine ligase
LLELNQELPAQLTSLNVKAVVPTTHGPLGEDGCLQGLLEVLGVPYAGSGVLASALAANKEVARRVFEQAALPIARGRAVNQAEFDTELPGLLRAELGRALVVKPVSGGSAIGVGRVAADAPDERLEEALAAAFEVDTTVVVECFQSGEEVTCGVLEDITGAPTALPPTRIRAKAADWYDFASRYGTGGSEHECPAPFSADLTRRIQSIALQAHRAVHARDLSRVDFIVSMETAEVTLLELNTLPGMTPTSLFPEAAAVIGVDFNSLCSRLAEQAMRRSPRRAPRVRGMPA